jgi:hypothetical protein
MGFGETELSALQLLRNDKSTDKYESRVCLACLDHTEMRAIVTVEESPFTRCACVESSEGLLSKFVTEDKPDQHNGEDSSTKAPRQDEVENTVSQMNLAQ